MQKWVLLQIFLILTMTCCKSASHADSTVLNRQDQFAKFDYEVKFNLKDDVVLQGELLSKAVTQMFQINESPMTTNILFLDDQSHSLQKTGWSIRARDKSNAKGVDLTFKRRFHIGGGGINAALSEAYSSGFDSSMPNFSGQVDWSTEKQTLSFSKTVHLDSRGISNMDLGTLRVSIKENLPKKLSNSGIDNNSGIISTAIIYGPVTAKRWQGLWQGKKISVEVWDMKTLKSDHSGIQNIVEVSFKESSEKKAKELRNSLMNELDDSGILAENDALKTNVLFSE
jgi:hypothetical protein